jgi:hypothetical protein
MGHRFPSLKCYVMLLQTLSVGDSAKPDKGKAENFIFVQEIQLLVCHGILHGVESEPLLLG